MVFQDVHVRHDLDCASKLDSKALDESLVREKKEGRSVNLLLSKEICKVLTV